MPEKVRAKKALGQHFLTDLGVARRIAATVGVDTLPKDNTPWGGLPILEIGPGMGVLTRFLMQDYPHREVKAIEIDTESVEYLSEVYPNLQVISGDFLKMDLNEIFPGEFVLIGNYPYNISSQIFFKTLDYRDRIPVISGMLQKEVARRICSSPGSKEYGILSVLLQTWYDCRYLFDVPPGVFSPPPKVTSGVLRLTRNNRRELGVSEKDFRRVVKTAFGQRRKTLRNSLSGLMGKENPIMNSEIMGQRPERLSPDEFIEITKSLPAKVD
ncbi:MAG: 16S rRNA (adenine(1518)-N(6)/adenine(1519)-N(6))-dimethyltransferase RsmA [Clostridium sp.]|nr:16S rRNA (adenine(1518)-N(6)/adenine(1519)-N(6))-dimethyltransferase RsmA [Prevotella sp.]MCM1429748.1 16S rRNA (adenine(1518)-N(6)/adenine(1519)-N(6))-dimethyltransferase RsmA [Clostridium sp.]MCM1476221.1 16S rRNA (adenine(1518)-N(6)/adenine(1519)-N(6))-dimethyltransferase RsmA [Muribaculaceae bacterium]